MIGALSVASRRRLEFIAANVGVAFGSIVTLTYHGRSEEGESEADRNWRIAKRSKRDLNRLLTCVRREVGHYLWVMEFQERGVVHFHVLCEREISESRLGLAWCRATGALEDPAAMRHAVKVEVVRGERGARSYLGRYLGKGRQKALPAGVAAAGRWWGRSKDHPMAPKLEVITREREGRERHEVPVRVLRSVRRWLRGELGFRVSGGAFTDWGGRLSARLLEVARKLGEFYALTVPETVEGAWRFVEVEGKGVGQ